MSVSRSKKTSAENARWCGGNLSSPKTSPQSQLWSCTEEQRKCWRHTMAIKRPSQTYHKPAASTVESQTHGGPAQNPPKQNRTVVSQSSPVQHRNERSQLHLTQKMSKATHLSQVRLCETSGARSLLIPTPSPGSCLRCWDVLHDHSNPPYTELQIRNCHNLLFFCFFFLTEWFYLAHWSLETFWFGWINKVDIPHSLCYTKSNMA